MAFVVVIISRHGFSIDSCNRNQLNKSKLVLYKALIHILKLLYICDKMEHLNYEDRCGVRGCHTCIDMFERKAGMGYR